MRFGMVFCVLHQQFVEFGKIVEGHAGVQVMLQVVADIVRREEKTFQSSGFYRPRGSKGLIVGQVAEMFGHAADVLEHEEGREVGDHPVQGVVFPPAENGQ